MYVILWEYRVSKERQSEFERIYSPDGAWTEFFKNGIGYLGTELLHSDQMPELYVTIDRWDSKEQHERFLSEWATDYEKLDKQCKGLTEYEKRIGGFTATRS